MPRCLLGSPIGNSTSAASENHCRLFQRSEISWRRCQIQENIGNGIFAAAAVGNNQPCCVITFDTEEACKKHIDNYRIISSCSGIVTLDNTYVGPLSQVTISLYLTKNCASLDLIAEQSDGVYPTDKVALLVQVTNREACKSSHILVL